MRSDDEVYNHLIIDEVYNHLIKHGIEECETLF